MDSVQSEKRLIGSVNAQAIGQNVQNQQRSE
jgi:hypothetical protein